MAIKAFTEVRQWAKIRGIKCANPQVQYQRFLQEGAEIHDAMIKNDMTEFKDAVGDTIVTLINLATQYGFDAEDCLKQAFDVIELRKGKTTEDGDFIRYQKLSKEDQDFCDEQQGSAGEQYFKPELLDVLTEKNFKG